MLGYAVTILVLFATVRINHPGAVLAAAPVAALVVAALISSRGFKAARDAAVCLFLPEDKLQSRQLEQARAMFRSMVGYALAAGLVVALIFAAREQYAAALKALAAGVAAGAFGFLPLVLQLEQKTAGGRPSFQSTGSPSARGPERQPARPQSEHRGQPAGPGGKPAEGNHRPGNQPGRPGHPPAGSGGGEPEGDRERGHHRRRRGNREFRDRHRVPNPNQSAIPAPGQGPARPPAGVVTSPGGAGTQPSLPGTPGGFSTPAPAATPRPAPVAPVSSAPTPLED